MLHGEDSWWDIGGGSTECVIGEGLEPLVRDSLYMGCVEYTVRFFADGQIDKTRMKKAELAAGLELRSLAARYRHMGWQEAIGSSGTILAIAQVIEAQGWSKRGITCTALRQLHTAVLTAGSAKALDLRGLTEERAPIFAAGVTILRAIFDAFRIERMIPSASALREGLLADLIGRIHHSDIRDRTISTLTQRYNVDQIPVGTSQRNGGSTFGAGRIELEP